VAPRIPAFVGMTRQRCLAMNALDRSPRPADSNEIIAT
jgi:hypothetical protein